ncbi:MAG: PLD nuclease N-terminal domain-containing protein [Acidimicrobiales bacterium]|jgi:hypothetical protein|nr:PLD nuclease N-terminal domain-containing protein [Acidimicrobiales bacterium]
MSRKRWADYSQGQQAAIIVAAAVELAMTAVALRDLAGRPADQVRGPRWAWALGCFVQPVGPVAYLAFGRKPVPPQG